MINNNGDTSIVDKILTNQDVLVALLLHIAKDARVKLLPIRAMWHALQFDDIEKEEEATRHLEEAEHHLEDVLRRLRAMENNSSFGDDELDAAQHIMMLCQNSAAQLLCVLKEHFGNLDDE